MNLWQKPIDQITFQDVDSFCAAGWEESARLDYKGEWPKDLAKTMAAMANTLGGMIVIGVDSDKTTNKPVWPPLPPVAGRRGFPLSAGLSEKVYQLGRDAIFPPIMPEVSPVLENKERPGQAILVVRIPESKDAPHATEGKKSVYVYERTGNQGYAHSLADIEYIERLFNRRQKIEADRERMIAAAIERARSRIGISGCPYRWASVIPYYPWRPVCTPEVCHTFHTGHWAPSDIVPHCSSFHHQRAPNGTFGIYFDAAPDRSLFPVGCTSISDKGHVFGITIDIEHSMTGTRDGTIYYDYTANLLVNVIKGAMNLYAAVDLERPIYLQISMGILDARNLVLATGKVQNLFRRHVSLFPDTSFRSDTTVLHFDADAKELAKPLLNELCFAFDATL